MKKILLPALLILLVFPIKAQVIQEKEPPVPTTRILFVLDASRSMFGRWQSDVKITIARRLLTDLLDSLESKENLQIGLRVYGHLKPYPPQDCNDTRLEVPFGENSITKIKQKLKAIAPKGTTPIALALQAAGNDFPECDNCRNIIILITDGIEECEGDPCAVSQALQKKGIILKPFVIGIGRNFAEAFDCVGTYYDASSEESFRTALNVVISQALNSTTAQVNLIDANGNASETNVNMSFYDDFSGLLKYNFIHTMNSKGLPDTLILDPLCTYNITVHTIPPVYKDTIKLIPGQHTTIPIDAPQGFLELEMGGLKVKGSQPYPCIIREKGTMETLNIQYFGQKEKYLTGKYDLEILSLPRIKVYDVDISQSHTTTVSVPSSGIAHVQRRGVGYGSIYLENDNKLEWVINLDPDKSYENILLQPGNYRAVYRSRYVNRSFYTIEKRFTIESGKTVKVNLYQ